MLIDWGGGGWWVLGCRAREIEKLRMSQRCAAVHACMGKVTFNIFIFIFFPFFPKETAGDSRAFALFCPIF